MANPEAQVARSLADAGVITIDTKRLLGLERHTYPVMDPIPEARTRDRLTDILAGRAAATDGDDTGAAVSRVVQATKTAIITAAVMPASSRGLSRAGSARRERWWSSGAGAWGSATGGRSIPFLQGPVRAKIHGNFCYGRGGRDSRTFLRRIFPSRDRGSSPSDAMTRLGTL